MDFKISPRKRMKKERNHWEKERIKKEE